MVPLYTRSRNKTTGVLLNRVPELVDSIKYPYPFIISTFFHWLLASNNKIPSGPW